MEITLPHQIENSTGEKLVFLRIVNKDGIEYLEGENEVQPNAGPPMHVHYKQDESFTVISGKMGYQVPGQEIKYAGPGETVLFPAGIPHKFWNAGNDLLRSKGFISPPGNAVYFLSQLFQSARENGGRPDFFDMAFLLHKYKSEFGMLEIPPLVQKTILPAMLMVGNLTGKYKKFRDSPPAL